VGSTGRCGPAQGVRRTGARRGERRGRRGSQRSTGSTGHEGACPARVRGGRQRVRRPLGAAHRRHRGAGAGRGGGRGSVLAGVRAGRARSAGGLCPARLPAGRAAGEHSGDTVQAARRARPPGPGLRHRDPLPRARGQRPAPRLSPRPRSPAPVSGRRGVRRPQGGHLLGAPGGPSPSESYRRRRPGRAGEQPVSSRPFKRVWLRRGRRRSRRSRQPSSRCRRRSWCRQPPWRSRPRAPRVP